MIPHERPKTKSYVAGKDLFLFSVFCIVTKKTGNTVARKLCGRAHPMADGVYLLYRLLEDDSTKSYGEEKTNRNSTDNKLFICLIANNQSYLRKRTGQLICMFWQTYGHAHEVVQVGMMKVAQQDSIGFDRGPDALETDLFVTDTRQDEVALRRDGFQVRLTGKYLEEACSFLDNFAHIAHDIVQVIERGDGGDMAGDVHLEGALGPPHVPGNP